MASTRVIGLDIGTTAIRAAELDTRQLRTGGRPTLLRIREVALPTGSVRDGEVVETEAVASAIKQLWSEAKFSQKNAVIGIGNQRVFTRELDMPWLPIDQVKSALPFQVQETLPMSVDDVLMDFFPTDEFDGNSGKMVHGLFVAAQKDTVNAGVLTLGNAGLQPVGVDLNAIAAARSVLTSDALSRVVAVVDVGARLTNISILDMGKPRLVRILPVGGQHLTDAIARVRGVSGPEAEQIKRELGVGVRAVAGYADASEAIESGVHNILEGMRTTLTYYHQNHPQRPVNGIVLTGGAVHLGGFGQYVASASRLAVSIGDPFSQLKVAKDAGESLLVGAPSSYCVAIGLAYGDFS